MICRSSEKIEDMDSNGNYQGHELIYPKKDIANIIETQISSIQIKTLSKKSTNQIWILGQQAQFFRGWSLFQGGECPYR